jgi:hypothetical protein
MHGSLDLALNDRPPSQLVADGRHAQKSKLGYQRKFFGVNTLRCTIENKIAI